MCSDDGDEDAAGHFYSPVHLGDGPRCGGQGLSGGQHKSGRIRGKILKLANGKEVAAFLGVFFAEPPVGELRFKVKTDANLASRKRAPVPKAPWNDIFNATSFGPLCAQSKNRSHWDIVRESSGRKILRRLGLWDYTQGEDCLNLNIYVPVEPLSKRNPNHLCDSSSQALPERNPGSNHLSIMFLIHGGSYKTNGFTRQKSSSKPLSIMFFIHGGSYKTNGGRFYPGEWLSSAGQVIVITVNYRLGVLGFLSTEDASARGNYGLLDQILALKWIKDNIAAFGGNSSDVTIFGNSAGGACVGLHLDFFESDCPERKSNRRVGRAEEARMYVERLARKLKCPDSNVSEVILACLRKIDPEQIIDKSEDAVTTVAFFPEDPGGLPDAAVCSGGRRGVPAQAPHHHAPARGIPLSPVPVMVGVTRDEPRSMDDEVLPGQRSRFHSFHQGPLKKVPVAPRAQGLHVRRRCDVLLHAVYTEYVQAWNDIASQKEKAATAEDEQRNCTLL
ncbi:neuroligin-1 [Caerostris extrusa]|uniref:Carboxylic ester hydrolase n=1 Tax=Caerostris extrusa TaxID=172846 RepID=A0AAV4TSI0_CAEEX|nr:neuroligin-1 [Caerostris extrusa]